MKKEIIRKENTKTNLKEMNEMTNTIKVKAVIDPNAAETAQGTEYDKKGTELIVPAGFYVRNGIMMRERQEIEKAHRNKDEEAYINYDFYKKEFYVTFFDDKMNVSRVYLKEAK